MKIISLFLGLCGSLNFAMSANALVGSAYIQLKGLVLSALGALFRHLIQKEAHCCRNIIKIVMHYMVN